MRPRQPPGRAGGRLSQDEGMVILQQIKAEKGIGHPYPAGVTGIVADELKARTGLDTVAVFRLLLEDKRAYYAGRTP